MKLPLRVVDEPNDGRTQLLLDARGERVSLSLEQIARLANLQQAADKLAEAAEKVSKRLDLLCEAYEAAYDVPGLTEERAAIRNALAAYRSAT